MLNKIKNIVSCLVLLICLFLLSGCVTVSSQKDKAGFFKSDYIKLETFCRKNNLTYDFDTIDDLISLHSQDKEIKVLLNSLVGVLNGSPFKLDKPPIYYSGSIQIPSQLEDLIKSRKFISFKPLYSIKKIVIDPGHGGKDPGAISRRGLKEKYINLIVAKLLKTRLEAEGYRIVMTRSTDTYLTLGQRVDVAKANSADLFISIHANANRSRKVSGAEIYYLSSSRLNSRKRASKLSKTNTFFKRRVPTDAKAILWEMVISKNYGFSVEMANILYYNFKKLGLKVKPARTAPFYVLRHAYVPSILVEMGYLTNTNEEKALRKKHYQKQIVEAITLSVNALSKTYSGRNRTYVHSR